jgi:hypothetical protein
VAKATMRRFSKVPVLTTVSLARSPRNTSRSGSAESAPAIRRISVAVSGRRGTCASRLELGSGAKLDPPLGGTRRIFKSRNATARTSMPSGAAAST